MLNSCGMEAVARNEAQRNAATSEQPGLLLHKAIEDDSHKKKPSYQAASKFYSWIN